MQFGQPQALMEVRIEAQDQSGWTMCSVRGMRHDWTSAHSQDGAFRTVGITKMQELSVIVSVCCMYMCVYAYTLALWIIAV